MKSTKSSAAFPVLNAPFGLQLRTPDGTVVPPPDAWRVMLKRESGNEVKSFEALAAYIKAQYDTNGGYLPSAFMLRGYLS
jgi:hypothetical protein